MTLTVEQEGLLVKLRKLMFLAPAAALPLLAAGPAQAATNGTYTVPLSQLNYSGASGTAVLTLSGDQLHVVIDAHGLVPNAPHAQHLHGMAGGEYTCPTDADIARLDKDGSKDSKGRTTLSVTEAAPMYGPIDYSLTTTGDYSMSSALAVTRFPTADASGNLHYDRTITVSPKVAASITSFHIVEHGVDENMDGTYDGDKKSELDPSLPAEATDPADCGAINTSQMSSMPMGGVDTGTGSTSGVEQLPAAVGGAAAIAGAGVLGAVALRRRRSAESR